MRTPQLRSRPDGLLRALPAEVRGFTLVELVVVMVVVAIVASLGAGRFADLVPFRAHAFASELAQMVAAAQRMAIAQRRTVYVRIDPSAGEVSLCLDAACAQRLAARPDGPDRLAVPQGLRLAPAGDVFSFDTTGVPSATTPARIDLVDSGGAVLEAGVLIEPGSGRATPR